MRRAKGRTPGSAPRVRGPTRTRRPRRVRQPKARRARRGRAPSNGRAASISRSLMLLRQARSGSAGQAPMTTPRARGRGGECLERECRRVERAESGARRRSTRQLDRPRQDRRRVPRSSSKRTSKPPAPRSQPGHASRPGQPRRRRAAQVRRGTPAHPGCCGRRKRIRVARSLDERQSVSRVAAQSGDLGKIARLVVADSGLRRFDDGDCAAASQPEGANGCGDDGFADFGTGSADRQDRHERRLAAPASRVRVLCGFSGDAEVTGGGARPSNRS